MWIKYRHGWAHGFGSYDYTEIPDNCSQEVLEDIVEELKSPNWWSDKYRGVQYELVDKPPKEYILGLISGLEVTIEGYNKRILQLKELI